MNIKVLIATFLVIGLINTQATQLEIIKTWNWARANPSALATRIQNRIRLRQKTGKKLGPKGDENCLTEAVARLRKQAPVALMDENVGMDLAAYTQAKDMLYHIHALKHIGSDKSSVEERMTRYGRFEGEYKYYEMLAYFKQTQPVTAIKIIELFATDCGNNKKRPHFDILFAKDATHFGAGVEYANKQTWITLISGRGFIRKGVPNTMLDIARVEGDGLMKQNADMIQTAEWRSAKYFKHKATPQIHDQNKIDKVDDSTGPLGNLKDDKSVNCPNYINPKKFTLRTVRTWTLTSRKCNREAKPWSEDTSRFIHRTLPFAQKGKCYHRLSWCSLEGRVWVFDREYITFNAAVEKYEPNMKSKLGDAKDDLSVRCPHFINPKILRKRIVQDWYMNGEKCVRGKKGFESNGFFRINPFAKEGKCYQRLKFCSEQGLVYLKDSEYKTYNEWATTA